jgi:metallo-beta-lactamase class B
MKTLSIKAPIKAFGLVSTLLFSSVALADDPSWSAPHAPYQITDNIYNVGTAGIAVYLITTPKGHILLDAATPEGAQVVEANIQSLGFRLKDIKYLIENHAHSDHAGGLAQLKKSTGAKLIASQGDRYALEHGTLDSEANWDDKFPPVKVDKTIADGKKITLGGTHLQAILTPGHTKGCTSWLTESQDKGALRRVIFVCSLTTAGNRLINNKIYPNIADDFRNSFARLKSISADILLLGHPSFANLEEKYQAQLQGKKDAFVDAEALPTLVANAAVAFEKELEKQKGSAQ